MTCLEHLIENCLCDFRDRKSAHQIREGIRKDINLKYAGITVDQCFEICQYVYYSWLPFITSSDFEEE